jgi:hypothetical protein
MMGIFCALVVTAMFVFGEYFLFRLETLVQRRLLVRFDRVNRKVYFHRPRYAGGVVTLDWDKVLYESGEFANVEGFEKPEETDVDHTGDVLTLSWLPDATPHGRAEVIMLGRMTKDGTESTDCWEFIRRYMEEGPESVPREELIGKIPWPWVALKMTFGKISGLFNLRALLALWRAPLTLLPGLAMMLLGLVFLGPAFLLYAFFQWMSLLLCWEPVFPRAIRKACGETFRDVLKLRGIDLVAWSMLGGFLWLVWPGLREAFF